ncbi:MAG: hypothetical protein GC178_16675 [Flavobacteriales bacterium]|nr:hypothetical protein [Flavobacteriales bacterium]
MLDYQLSQSIMDTNTKSQLIKKLKSIVVDEPATIRAAVAIEALEYHDPEAFFNDLFSHGCVSGMVSSLIYYNDTHEFFDAHYDEIEDLRLEYIESTGDPLTVKDDLKNWFAWFSFEETARSLANELDL